MPKDNSKPFLTYEEQIAKLESKGLIITNKDHAIKILKEHSYFALISGYKQLFKKENGNYRLHTSIEDIYRLYEFDNKLRSLLLHNILKVERNIKSQLSYAFCQKYGAEQEHYLEAKNYSPNKSNIEVNKLIDKLKIIEKSPKDYAYINHQKTKHGNVPLWVMMKALTLGVVSKMYTFLPNALQSEISKNFLSVNEQMLQYMLSLLSRVRNVCAHNERLFDYKDTTTIPNTQIHLLLNIAKHKGQYKKGKKDFFAVVIVLKYLLDNVEFNLFINELSQLISNLLAEKSILNSTELYKKMGLPENWKDIAKIDIS